MQKGPPSNSLSEKLFEIVFEVFGELFTKFPILNQI